MTITDLTPKHLKCSATMSCPSIHRLEDGRIMIVGDDGVPEAFARDIPVGAAESAVTITEDLLSLYVSEKTDKLQAQVDALYSAASGALERCELIAADAALNEREAAEYAAKLLREAIAEVFDLVQQRGEEEHKHCDHPGSEWQPIETAPKDVTVVLLYRYRRGSLSWSICYWDAEKSGWVKYDNPDSTFDGATHWMPLPASPQTVLDRPAASGDHPGSARDCANDIDYLSAQETTLMAILMSLGEEDVITRFSLTERLEQVREELSASLSASGDRTENAPIKTSVEP